MMAVKIEPQFESYESALTTRHLHLHRQVGVNNLPNANCVREGSMDPYSRAPRSPKSKQQSSKVFFDTGLTSGPQIEDCKSPSLEQVGFTFISIICF